MSLAKTSKKVRMALKAGLGILAVIFLSFVLYRIGYFLKNKFFPAPPVPPEEKFGKLPSLESSRQTETIIYKLNTLTGKLPNFADRIRVYGIKKDQPGLLTLSKTREKLNNVGFNSQETKISESLYSWKNERSNSSLQYDIFSHNFDILSNYLSNDLPVADENEAKETVSDFLQRITEDTTDLDQEKILTSLFEIKNSVLVQTNSAKLAQVVRIDFFQKPTEGIEIFYPFYSNSSMRFFVTDQIVEAHFVHKQIDIDNFSTYPIKTSQEAFEELKQAKALIFNPANSKEVEITDVSLGYFLDEKDQDFVHPIIVFRGKNFKAYVNALPSSSLKDSGP